MGTKARKRKSELRRSPIELVPPARRVADRAPDPRGPGATVPPTLKVVSSNVRWAKVKTAQARVAADYYERRDVKEALLDAVLEELSRH